MSERTKTWLKRGIAALLLVVLVYFFLPLLGELKAAVVLFRDANWIWFGIAVAVQLISYASLTWLNSLALQPFQGKIAFTRLAAVLTSMAFIQVAMPSMGISGVAMRVHLLKKSGYRPEDSLASLVVETLGEALAITTLALIGVTFVLGKGVSVTYQLASYFLVMFIFLGLAGYIWRVVSDPVLTRSHLVFFASRWDRLSWRWGNLNVAKVEQRLSEFRSNMRNYRKVPLWKLSLSSYAKVILDVATLGAAFYMFGYSISASDLLIGYGLILLFSGSASLPGGLGMTEAYAPVIFTWLGVPGSVALAAGLVYRLIAFWFVRFIGYFCWHALEFETPVGFGILRTSGVEKNISKTPNKKDLCIGGGGYNQVMNSRQRFLETMQPGRPDRPPLFDEGQREEVLEAWRRQGMPEGAVLSELFAIDERDEIEPDLYPSPNLEPWPAKLEALGALQESLNPDDPVRLPENWNARVQGWMNHQQTVMLRVHRGFFESIGVENWRRFYQMMFLVKDEPRLVHRMLEIQGEFNARIAERVLRDVQVDAAIFSEPIGDNHGPLISPRTYRELVLPTYQPVLDVLRRYNVRTVILRAYANVYPLIPDLLKLGFNCLWVVEVRAPAIDYLRLRGEFGRDLRLIGGLDLDVLRQGQESIRRELEDKLPLLLEQGGYAPLLDGRVRQDVPWENYRYYRDLLQRICAGRGD